MQLDAEAQLIKAENEAKAKKAEADGIAYYNAKVAQNMEVQQQQACSTTELSNRLTSSKSCK